MTNNMEPYWIRVLHRYWWSIPCAKYSRQQNSYSLMHHHK